MTRYNAQIVTPYRDHRDIDIYPDYSDVPTSMVITGYNYEPAKPNPDDCDESYRPVTLTWETRQNGIYYVPPMAVNGHRGNRVYRITGPGATNTSQVSVNGVIIPIDFYSVADAKLFAQHIEDTNTED